MAVVSSIFLVVALALSVFVGAQTRAWTWGPAMIALAVSVAAALPSIWQKGRVTGNFVLMAFGWLVTAWFAWRAWFSPVQELGMADLMLLAGAVGSFVSIRAIEGNKVAERILIWGIALLLAANVVAIGMQVRDPSFAPIFRARAAAFPSGFYSHYNEAANFLIATILLVTATAILGRHHWVTRIVLGLISIAGLTAIWFTHSRGGIVGVAVGMTVLMISALFIGYRSKAKWVPVAMIALPIICLGVGAYAWIALQNSQAVRQSGTGISEMMDNSGRLYFLGVALSCIATHPLAGGGSRSFSWESFRFFERKLQGDSITHKAEQVHNEIVQAATDYGITGAGMLMLLIGGLTMIVVIRVLFSNSEKEGHTANVWRAGGLAAMAGMFLQSSFSFVFHLLPGVILLGICLGKMARSSTDEQKTVPEKGAKILLTLAAFASLLLLVPMGIKATRILSILWPTYLGKVALTAPESKIDRLSDAILIWPTADFYQERGTTFQTLATSNPEDERNLFESAIADYSKAEKLHPFDPGPTVNRANLLSKLGRDTEAEDAYDRAISLQGGMEPAFRSRFLLVGHLLKKGVRIFTPEDPAPALAVLEVAAQQMEKCAKEMHWLIPDMKETHVAVYDTLGAAREANGDYRGAMEAYLFSIDLPDGYQMQYRVGILCRKLADNAWNARKPAEALGYYLEAKKRIGWAPFLPKGITPEQKLKDIGHIDEKIAFLKGAKVEPIPAKLE